MILRYRIFATTALAAAATLLLTQTPALPAAPAQAAITAHLRAYPGGTQISPTEISYNSGRFVITFTRPTVGILGADCPYGSFCFYDYRDFLYPRGRLSDCGWQDLSKYGWHDRTESVHANIPRGSVAFYNHGNMVSHSGDTHLFTVHAGQANPDTKPRNSADHVERFC